MTDGQGKRRKSGQASSRTPATTTTTVRRQMKPNHPGACSGSIVSTWQPLCLRTFDKRQWQNMFCGVHCALLCAHYGGSVVHRDSVARSVQSFPEVLMGY